MRNLKRALSLALASVMLLGMMVVGSSAKGIDDFTDKAEIVNQDAVAVTSAIGMFEGYEDGSFGPENVVTRAEMAVIICTMLYGAGVNVNQFAETNVFTDVPAWAQGYVNLCSSLGIVAGVGDGKFDPNATVTTAQAVLMLCRALGYFQSAADFGSDWMLAATAKGTALGLYGDLKLTANAGLTRDNVAELVFNALTKAVPVQYNELLGVYYNENQGIIYSLEFNYLQTLGYKNFDLVYRTDTETIYGRPGTTWGTGSYNVPTNAGTTQKDEYLTENGGLIADKVRMLDKNEIITVPNTPDYVYTANTKEEAVYDDLGSTVCNDTKGDDKYTWTAFINGEEQDEAVIPTENEDDKWVYTDKGAVVEVYIDDYTLDVTVVEINYYLGEVSKVDGDEGTINVRALSSEAKLDDRTFATADFEEDDYVVFTVDYNDDEDFYICELMAPETVSGEVTRVDKDAESNSANNDNDDSYVRIDGNKYSYASKNHNVYDLDEGKNVHPVLNENYTLYLTPEGYILGYALADQSPDQYLYVEDSDEELGDWVAKVVLEDGTSSKVELKNDYVKSDNGDYDIKWVKDDGTDYGPSDQIQKVRTNIDKHVFAYTVNDAGLYTLTEADHLCYDTVDTQTTVTGVQIHNGKAYIETGANSIIVDRDTIFVDVDNNVAYTGYDEVPNVDDADIAYVKDGRTAEVVFIVNGEIYDENSTYFMLTDKTRESLNKDEDFWEYSKAYVNGQKQTITVAYDAVQMWDAAKGEWVKDTSKVNKVLEVGVLYKAVKSNDDGYFTAIRPVKLDNEFVTEVAHDAFWITDNHNYAEDKQVKYDTDGETIFVVVEQTYKKNGDEDKLVIDDGDINDMFEGVDDDGMISYVSVIEEDEEYAELVYIWLEKAPVLSDDASVKSIEFKGIEVNSDGYEDGETYSLEIPYGKNISNDEFKAAITVADYADVEVFWGDGTTDVYAGDMDSSTDAISGLPATLTIVCTSQDGEKTSTVKVNLSEGAAPEAGEKITGDVTVIRSGNPADLAAEPSGAYVFETITTPPAAGLSGNADENIFFKFTTTRNNQSVKVVIKDNEGETLWTETLKFTDEGDHYSYVHILNRADDDHDHNLGMGTGLKTGSYSWSVTSGDDVLAAGSFTVE